MKKLKNKIIRKELRAYRNSFYERLSKIMTKGLYTSNFQSTLCLNRHGFEIESIEGDKAYLIYPDGKTKIVELK